MEAWRPVPSLPQKEQKAGLASRANQPIRACGLKRNRRCRLANLLAGNRGPAERPVHRPQHPLGLHFMRCRRRSLGILFSPREYVKQPVQELT